MTFNELMFQTKVQPEVFLLSLSIFNIGIISNEWVKRDYTGH